MNASASRLDGATRELMLHWQETKNYWRDAKSMEFERQYLAELAPSVGKTVAVIEDLDKLLAKIRKDCE
jgi:hypothetical protein